MKVKKWLLGFMTFAAMVVLCAVCAGAETYGDFEYGVLDDGTVQITDCETGAEKVVIPDTIDGKSVTSIGEFAFFDCTSLTSITIPNSVTEIGWYAFYGCSSLPSVTIPDSVTNIGWWAFKDCINLTSVTIPDSVTSIGDEAFIGCTSLAKIEVADKNTNYVSVNGVLYDKNTTTLICYPTGKKDKNFRIIDGVTNIGGGVFRDCINLTNVTIPDSVTSIGNCAFEDCVNLTNIVIPDSVTEIGYWAFSGCKSLTSITIPDNVSKIDSGTFNGCASLTAINIATGNQSYVSVDGVLYNKDKTAIICYPEGKKDNNYKILDSVTSIDQYTFSNCLNLLNITIPNSVTIINNEAFCNCSSLKNVTIPDSVTWIGTNAFSNCSSITSVTIPNSVTSTGDGIFKGCVSLTSVTIPNSLTSISGSAFNGCTRLTNITIPDSVTNIGSRAFEGCTSLTSITIPSSVTSIDLLSFDGCISNFKIYCYPGTAGEKYAKDNGFTYELLDNPALAKVTGVKLGGRAADALRINWTKNASADGYIVEMYQGNKWVRVAKITSNTTTTFRKAGLKASSVYKFRVRAYKMSGKTALYGNYSATVAARTNPSVIKGAKLTGRAADALRINWTKNTSADGYIVEMYQGNKWVRVGKITNNSTTTFRKAGLKASSVYKFRVRAYKMSGKTALYGNYSATVTARTNPSIVKGVKIGGKAKDALRVNWAKNASAQGYIVEMYKGGKWVRVAKITNGNTTTFRKAGLAKNTAYKFRVKAYYMSGKTALYGNYGSVSGKTAAK